MNIKNSRIIALIQLSRQAFGRYKWQIIILTILGFLSGLFEGIGVNALIPLLSFFIKDSLPGNDIISRFLRESFLRFNIDFSLKQILIFISILFILKAIAMLVFSYINIKITANFEERTRNSLLGKTLTASWPYLLKQKLGLLENTLKTDVDRSSALLGLIGNLIMLIAGLIVYISIAINIDFNITIITLLLGGVLFFSFKPLIRRTRKTAHDVVELNRQVAHFVNESITGIKTMKVMFANNKIIDAGSEFFRRFKKAKIRIFLLKTLSSTMLEPISLIFICVVFAFSYKTPNFNFSSLIAVIYLIQKIFQYIQMLQTTLHNFNEGAPYLQSVLNYEKQVETNQEADREIKKFEFKEKLEFEKVNFNYNPETEVLSKVSFNIKKGELVGLIGPSGGGKTTIVDLILRLFNPNQGEITLDGISISEINLKEWRENIGYVSQDIFLKNDTIAANIRFYNDSITDEEIITAAKMANIYDFIESCPDKFLTVIGDRGILLSAGQRQRIVIARVLARKPKILILDEATSALDNESEVKIQQVIDGLKRKVTVFVIAHRLSTVINCDKLMVLDNGKIAEQGPPAELLKNKDSYFYKVYNIRNN
jgi:ATP-binding cassette, subfamily B, bacterial MsbA